jgi:hypothetical protein
MIERREGKDGILQNCHPQKKKKKLFIWGAAVAQR